MKDMVTGAMMDAGGDTGTVWTTCAGKVAKGTGVESRPGRETRKSVPQVSQNNQVVEIGRWQEGQAHEVRWAVGGTSGITDRSFV